MSDSLNQFFGFLCGQNPDHTWAPGGILLPVCQRCTGLYVGAAVAALLHWWLKPRLTPRFLWAHGVFLALMAPCGFHWVPQGPALRTISGLLFGFGVTAFLKAPLVKSEIRNPKSETNSKSQSAVTYYTGLTITLLLVPLLAARGGWLAAALFSGAAFFGAVALAIMILADTGIALAGLRERVRCRADAGAGP